MTPSPLQSGHAPLELAENSAASTAVGLGEGLAHVVENAGIGRGVRAARAARQVLVDDDGFRIGRGQAALDQR